MMLGPPPAYSEAIASIPSSSSGPSSSSANANAIVTIWTVPVPTSSVPSADTNIAAGQWTPPPSYAESLRANPADGHGRCSRCGPSRTANNASARGAGGNTMCSRHLHRCPSRHRHGRNNGAGNGLSLVFPAERSLQRSAPALERTSSTRRPSSRELEAGATTTTALPSAQNGGADRFRDLFLTILMRVLLIFLFVVFMRILIAQLSNEE